MCIIYVFLKVLKGSDASIFPILLSIIFITIADSELCKVV